MRDAPAELTAMPMFSKECYNLSVKTVQDQSILDGNAHDCGEII